MIVREVNFGGTTGFHGSWSFDDQGVQPFHQLILQFNSRWPIRRVLLGAELLRVSELEWRGSDYARRRIHVRHTDSYLRQPNLYWLSARTLILVQDPVPAIQDVPMLAIQAPVMLQPPKQIPQTMQDPLVSQSQVSVMRPLADRAAPPPSPPTVHARDSPDEASRVVRRRLS